MRQIAYLLLGAWLILHGLQGIIHLSFRYDDLVLGGLAIAAGVLLIIVRR
ncbi:hypothetical protein [Arhodomonas sp. SL1]